MSTYSHCIVPTGTIVVGIDDDGSSEQALAWAIRQALLDHRPLTIAHAGRSDLDGRGNADVSHRLVEDTCAEARRRVRKLEVHGVVSPVDPRSLLVELSEQAAMVVVGSRGRGPAASTMLGSVGADLARHAHCPVLVHRPGGVGMVRRGVLAGIEGDEGSREVLEQAFRLAAQRGLALTVLHAYLELCTTSVGVVAPTSSEPVEHELLLAEVMAGMSEKYPDVYVAAHVVRGAPEAALITEATHADLVVVGSHHGGLASGLASGLPFGSVSASVVEHVTCPVLVVRH